MGGGLMQLVAYGAQDIYLTGNPQITFFKVVYRRHTNFSMETIEQTINGSSAVNGSGTVTISRNGDLVYKVYVTCDDVTVNGSALGNNLINNIELEIGGQKIDKQTTEWNQIWADLTTPESKATGFQCMTGGCSNANAVGVGQIQVPLNFWFCRNPGLALPLIALQYHEVKLKCLWGGTTGTRKVLCDYIYLDTDERRRFAQVSHEYLIEQIQEQTLGGTTSEKLNFNHPVKELIWTNQATADYNTALLKLNGHDRFSSQQSEYFQLRQPLDYHTAVPGQNIVLTDRPQMLPTQRLVCASATGDAIANATDSSESKVTIAAALTNSVSVGDILIVGISSGDVEVADARTVTVVAVGEESADFTVTPRITALTDDANNSFSFGIVARAQDPVSRTGSLTKKINVYSFGLKPEEHQPSGTCNFSRIDNAKLDFTGTPPNSSQTIYAVNYNVLRIMSGMGGLAYSN
tara:strand:+ start:1345 stop:2733 length:1389 start_codon:yes stop_codon:yes gene_type:complete